MIREQKSKILGKGAENEEEGMVKLPRGGFIAPIKLFVLYLYT